MEITNTYTDDELAAALLSPKQVRRGWRVVEIVRQRVCPRRNGAFVAVVFRVVGVEGRESTRLAVLIEAWGRLHCSFATSSRSELIALGNAADHLVDMIEGLGAEERQARASTAHGFQPMPTRRLVGGRRDG